MTVLGLHVLDFGIVCVYVVFILWLGYRAHRRSRDEEGFYLADRGLGKVFQFFLNFGNSTDTNQAVAVSREIYRQGIGGMWIQYIVLFITPFYWFTTMLFRRSRLITMGDLFTERYRSKFLGGMYAVFALLFTFIISGTGYMVAGKTMMALTPKPASEYTQQERLSVERFEEFQELKRQPGETLTPQERDRLQVLQEYNKRGELNAFISYVEPVTFYLIYALIVVVYTMLGGWVAAAITDTIQGVLIILFSFILVPIGLVKIGGFSGLHASVPDFMFHLFGSGTLSEYAWYTIAAIAFSNLVSIIALPTGMPTAGSAKNEMDARFGMIGGMFFKRFIMIFWALAGLLALGLFAGQISDPDLIWGYMTRQLLFPGAIGLMLAGILATNMSTLDAGAVSNSALFIRNIYKPLFPDKSDRFYMILGRIIIAVSLLGGIAAALLIDDLLQLLKYLISFPAIFGAAIWLGYVWRRLTRWAVIIQVFLCLIVYAIVPNLFQHLDATRTHKPFLEVTEPYTETYVTNAMKSDVQIGRADSVGQRIRKTRTIEARGIFFEEVARINPEDPDSPKEGVGRFNAELWILSWFGLEFDHLKKAQLVAIRFLFDAIFPFLILFLVSFVTRPPSERTLNEFFGKIHTPVQPTEEQEREAIEDAVARPEQFEENKLWPGSNWEILKPGKYDYLGFGGSWVIVIVVIIVLWWVMQIGS